MSLCRNVKGVGRRLCHSLCFALVCSIGVQGAADGHHVKQGVDRRSEAVGSDTQTARERELSDTVAILPWSYKGGKEVALQSSREVCNQLLLETGFNVFLVKSPTGAMPPANTGTNASKRAEPPFEHLLNEGRALLGQEITGRADSAFVLPTLDQMTQMGQNLGTRYILAGRAQWSSRNVWVGAFNRKKAICTVDVLIFDTADNHLVLDAHNIMGDSTESKSMFATITSVISLNPIPLVIPGSVTPEEQRAVTVAVSKALAPWIKTERIKKALDQADASGEAAGGGVKFSTLLAPTQDLQVGMTVTVQQASTLQALDPDLARLAVLGDVTLQFKEQNRLRLSAESPKDGLTALILNEDSRAFLVPERKIAHEQDLSAAPDRRLFLLDFCGLLTRGMFDALRARFVRADALNGVDTVVYDLTYWDAQDTAYRRIWIDPLKHLVVRSELHDRNGKLRVIALYERSAQFADGIWLPTRVVIEQADQKPAAALTLNSPQIDTGQPDASFSIPTRTAANTQQ